MPFLNQKLPSLDIQKSYENQNPKIFNTEFEKKYRTLLKNKQREIEILLNDESYWKKIKKSNCTDADISLYTNKTSKKDAKEGTIKSLFQKSKFYCYKVKAKIRNKSMESLEDVFMDHNPETVIKGYNKVIKSFKILYKKGDFEVIQEEMTFEGTDDPQMLMNREFLYCYLHSKQETNNNKNKKVIGFGISLEDEDAKHIPLVSPKTIRAKMIGGIILNPMEDGSVELTKFVHGDPKGTFPRIIYHLGCSWTHISSVKTMLSECKEFSKEVQY